MSDILPARDPVAPPKTAADETTGERYTAGALADASAWTSRALLWISGAGLIFMSLIILWQVFARYVLNASPSWSEQLALYILIWTVFLAGAAGVREGFHIRITAVRDSLAPALRPVMIAVGHGVTAAAGVFLAAYGATLAATLWPYDIPTLGLPRGSAILPVILSGVLIAAFSLEHIAADFRGREVRPVWR